MEELRQRSHLLTGYLEFLIDSAMPAVKGTAANGTVTCEIITPQRLGPVRMPTVFEVQLRHKEYVRRAC